MELIDYLRMLARRWRWVVGFALLGWVAGALWATLTPRVYEASTLLFVGNSGAAVSDAQDPLSASRFTLERMQSYAALVDSPEVTRAVDDELGLPGEPKDVADALSAGVLDDTVVLAITARGEQPAATASMANVAAARLGAVIQLVEAPGNGAASPIRTTVTQPADAPDSPVSPNVALALALGLAAGIGAGLLAATLREQARGGDTGRTGGASGRRRPGGLAAEDEPRPAPRSDRRRLPLRDPRPADEQTVAAPVSGEDPRAYSRG
jgi:succinoglycan biosynthesis transport protein ExoP